MELGEITNPLAALIAGAITGLHCAGMCGPLSGALVCRSGTGDVSWRALGFYHGARLLSYTLIGAALGAVGKPASAAFNSPVATLIPWVFACLFLLVGLGLERWIPQPRFVSKWIFGRLLKPGNGGRSSLLLGMVTPLIPCAPLYIVFGATLLAGSWGNGALLMLAFGAGTIPVYAFIQFQLLFWKKRMGPGLIQIFRQGLALVAAGMIIARALAGEGLETTECPMCHGKEDRSGKVEVRSKP